MESGSAPGARFRPRFKDGREGNHRHKIPSGTLVAGVCNEVAVRVYNPSGKGGFLSEAPFLMTYFLECVFEGEWEFLAGDARVSVRVVLLKTRPATLVVRRVPGVQPGVGEGGDSSSMARSCRSCHPKNPSGR